MSKSKVLTTVGGGFVMSSKDSYDELRELVFA